MSFDDSTVLAVIPARSGSKGIPRKNLQQVGGDSLIAWAAKTVLELPWLDAAVLSTDDEEMAQEGRRTGLNVPFIRPDELATDDAGSVAMWRHAWLESEKYYDMRFDCSILLQPTTPLRRASDVQRTLQAMLQGGHRAAMTVSRVPGHFAPEKLLTLGQQGRVCTTALGRKAISIRQHLPEYYWRNGACYAVRRETLVDDGLITEDDCVAVILDRFMVNIDDSYELDLCEFILNQEKNP